LHPSTRWDYWVRAGIAPDLTNLSAVPTPSPTWTFGQDHGERRSVVLKRIAAKIVIAAGRT
jgi:hypothetical protein